MNEVKPSPVHKIERNPKPSSGPDVHMALDTEIEDEKGLHEMAMDWHDLHVPDDDPNIGSLRKRDPPEGHSWQ